MKKNRNIGVIFLLIVFGITMLSLKTIDSAPNENSLTHKGLLDNEDVSVVGQAIYSRRKAERYNEMNGYNHREGKLPCLNSIVGQTLNLSRLYPLGQCLYNKQKLKEAKNYIMTHEMNSHYCILVDFSIHSGKKRMFLYQLSNDSLIRKDIVTEGSCDNLNGGSDSVRFSNQAESHCSSLGKYKIGIRSYSSWGINIHYKLHGLEASNNKAYKRIIVFHSWDAVDEEEIYPYESPYSWGCPAVSNSTMYYYDELLQKEKNMLMWLYE